MKYWLSKISRVEVKPRPSGIDLRYSEWIRPPKFIRKFLKTLVWQDFVQYPDTNLLRDRIALHHNVNKENIFLGPGSAECIKAVFECFTASESVLVSEPCFPMYNVYAEQTGIHINHIQAESNLTYANEKWHGCNFTIVTRPSSPLGHCFSKEEIINILRKNIDRWVLVDEAYIGYAEGQEDIVDLINIYKNLIVCRSFSKTFGAAGIRVGYLLSCAENIKIISKFRQMYEVTGPSLRYAIYLLDNHIEVERYCTDTILERKKLCKLFENSGYAVVSSQGNWIHIEQKEPLMDILKIHNIHVKDNIQLPYSEHKWIRLTVCPGLSRIFKKIL